MSTTPLTLNEIYQLAKKVTNLEPIFPQANIEHNAKLSKVLDEMSMYERVKGDVHKGNGNSRAIFFVPFLTKNYIITTIFYYFLYSVR